MTDPLLTKQLVTTMIDDCNSSINMFGILFLLFYYSLIAIRIIFSFAAMVRI